MFENAVIQQNPISLYLSDFFSFSFYMMPLSVWPNLDIVNLDEDVPFYFDS